MDNITGITLTTRFDIKQIIDFIHILYPAMHNLYQNVLCNKVRVKHETVRVNL